MSTSLPVIVVLLLVGVLPTWPHGASGGLRPSGGLGILLIVFVLLPTGPLQGCLPAGPCAASLD